MARQSKRRSIIKDDYPPKFPFFAVVILGHDDREDIRIFKSRRSAEHLHFKVAAGIHKGGHFFDVNGRWVTVQSSHMFGVFSNDLKIVLRSIDEYNATLIYCSIPGSGGNDIAIDDLFRSVH